MIYKSATMTHVSAPRRAILQPTGQDGWTAPKNYHLYLHDLLELLEATMTPFSAPRTVIVQLTRHIETVENVM